MNDRRKKGLEKEISRIIGMTILTEVKNEKINQTEKVQGIIKISGEEAENIRNTRIIRIRDNIADINTKKEIMVPLIDEFVTKIDFPNNRIEVSLIDGMRE